MLGSLLLQFPLNTNHIARSLVSDSLRSMLEAKAFLRDTSTGRVGGFRNQCQGAQHTLGSSKVWEGFLFKDSALMLCHVSKQKCTSKGKY